jgi:hypothetical protein
VGRKKGIFKKGRHRIFFFPAFYVGRFKIGKQTNGMKEIDK